MEDLGTIKNTLSKKDRKSLGVLEDGETRRQKLWERCILDAKKKLKLAQELRFEVVEIAKKCCIIHLGGSVGTGNRYTLRNFAKEIGVPWGTFYDWYQTKVNIYDNLPEKEKKETSFAEMRYIERSLTGTRWKDVQDKKKLISLTLEEIKKKTATTIKMEKYLKQLKTIHFNSRNKIMIKDCDTEVLGEICHTARAIISDLAKYDRKNK